MEGQQGSGETKGDTQKKQKMPIFKGKQFFTQKQKRKEKRTKQTNKKTNKEGLGPGGVAFRATSPDP